MLEYLTNYYVFMLILMVLSFLVPKEEYRVYIQFFVGIFLLVLLLEPILQFLTMENPTGIYEIFETLNEKMEEVYHEAVFLEGEGK